MSEEKKQDWTEVLACAQKEIRELERGKVNLKGKVYTQVSTRVEIFRKHFGVDRWRVITDYEMGNNGAIFKATIYIDDTPISTGHSFIDSVKAKDKGLEKQETVAIGRALASFGLMGGEFASDRDWETGVSSM